MSEREVSTYIHRADSRLVPSQWETSLQSNAANHWLGTNLKSALHAFYISFGHCCPIFLQVLGYCHHLSRGLGGHSIRQSDGRHVGQTKPLLELSCLQFFLDQFPTYQGHLLSHPGIPGVTLCFCTGSYAASSASATNRRPLFKW